LLFADKVDFIKNEGLLYALFRYRISPVSNKELVDQLVIQCKSPQDAKGNTVGVVKKGDVKCNIFRVCYNEPDYIQSHRAAMFKRIAIFIRTGGFIYDSDRNNRYGEVPAARKSFLVAFSAKLKAICDDLSSKTIEENMRNISPGYLLMDLHMHCRFRENSWKVADACNLRLCANLAPFTYITRSPIPPPRPRAEPLNPERNLPFLTMNAVPLDDALQIIPHSMALALGGIFKSEEGAERDCCVCMCEHTLDPILISVGCGHVVCEECMINLFLVSTTRSVPCPMCRVAMNRTESVIMVYKSKTSEFRKVDAYRDFQSVGRYRLSDYNPSLESSSAGPSSSSAGPSSSSAGPSSSSASSLLPPPQAEVIIPSSFPHAGYIPNTCGFEYDKVPRPRDAFFRYLDDIPDEHRWSLLPLGAKREDYMYKQGMALVFALLSHGFSRIPMEGYPQSPLSSSSLFVPDDSMNESRDVHIQQPHEFEKLVHKIKKGDPKPLDRIVVYCSRGISMARAEICNFFGVNNVKCLMINGGVKPKDRSKILATFMDKSTLGSGVPVVLFVSPNIACTGLDFTIAQTIVSIYSPKDNDTVTQMAGRLTRITQKESQTNMVYFSPLNTISHFLQDSDEASVEVKRKYQAGRVIDAMFKVVENMGI
jgi:hypothetical protein